MAGDNGRRASQSSADSLSSTASSQISPKSTPRPARVSTTPERAESSALVSKRSHHLANEGQEIERQRLDDAGCSVNNLRLPSEDSTLNVCICQPDPKIPRPRNAFILYRQHHQASIIGQHPGLTNPEISKIIGAQWKNQSPEVKNEWKHLAQEEKARHHSQYPDYRYQPRRTKRKLSSIDPSAPLSPTPRCSKCGGQSALTPNTPTSAELAQTMLPPLTPTSAGPDLNQRFIPTMNGLSLVSPLGPRPIAVHPANFTIVPHAGYYFAPDTDSANRAQLSPDAKRRRLNAGPTYPNVSRASISWPIPVASPNREMFVPAENTAKLAAPLASFMAPPPKSSPASQIQQRARSLTLPPLRLDKEQAKNTEGAAKNMAHLGKINILSRICPPFAQCGALSDSKPRGAMIAIEGDDQSAVSELAAWLGTQLGRLPDYHVRTAQGPKLVKETQKMVIEDYLALIIDWHEKSRKIIDFLTTPPVPEPEESASTNAERHRSNSPSNECVPVVVLERYQLYAADTFASKILIGDKYSPVDHWQWMATLWREIIGPDLTIFVKDVTPEEMAAGGRAVDVNEDVRCITFMRKKVAGRNAGSSRLEERELRRLAFEVGEWVRNVAKGKGESSVMDGVSEKMDSSN